MFSRFFYFLQLKKDRLANWLKKLFTWDNFKRISVVSIITLFWFLNLGLLIGYMVNLLPLANNTGWLVIWSLTIILLLLTTAIIGRGWLDKLLRLWSESRLLKIALPLLIIFGFWLFLNQGTWIILPFDTAQVDEDDLKDGSEIATHLIAELNHIGVGNPAPTLHFWQLGDPVTSKGVSVFLLEPGSNADEPENELSLEKDCDAILRGPSRFIEENSISLQRVSADDQDNTFDFGEITLGNLNIPTRFLSQIFLKTVNTNYRELTGQLHQNGKDLKIVVSVSHAATNDQISPSLAWRVAGPIEAYPEMMEYLSLRMSLDMHPEWIEKSETTGLPQDWKLAFVLGNEAFSRKQFQKALNFYKIAAQFNNNSGEIDALIGLSEYQLERSKGKEKINYEVALNALNAAVTKNNKGNYLFTPYLACLYFEEGTDPQMAGQLLEQIHKYLELLKTENQPLRIQALEKLKVLGPNQPIKFPSGTNNYGLYVNKENQIVVTQTHNAENVLYHQAIGSLPIVHHEPRQLFLDTRNDLWLVSHDGGLYYHRLENIVDNTKLITDTISLLSNESELLQGNTINGIQQVHITEINKHMSHLFLLDRFGTAYWCLLVASSDGISLNDPACKASKPKAFLSKITPTPIVRQIWAIQENKLLMLTEDGVLWLEQVGANGPKNQPRRLIEPSSLKVLSFYVVEETNPIQIYLLYDNRNIGLFVDGNTEQVVIDESINNSIIYPTKDYVYLLKEDGNIVKITFSENAEPDVSTINKSLVECDSSQNNSLSLPIVGEKTQGLMVVKNVEGEFIYLLTEQRILLGCKMKVDENSIEESSDNVSVTSSS